MGVNRFAIAASSVAVVLALKFMPLAARAQAGDLNGDLDGLNIRHRTAHYALAGTVSQDRLVEYGRCLEYIYEEYAAGFAELLERSSASSDKPVQTTERQPRQAKTAATQVRDRSPASSFLSTSERFKVIVFATDSQYQEFGREYFDTRAESTRGLFVPRASLLLIRDEPASQQTYEILFHEAFHQFVHRHVPLMPIWLNEGLATYYGTARPTKTGLTFKEPRSAYFRVVRKATSAKRLIPFDKLMTYSAATFYSRDAIEGLGFDRVTLSYAQSYTLVCYTLHDEEGRRHLRKYIRSLADARTRQDVQRITRVHFDEKLLAAMVPLWQGFVNRGGSP